MTAACRGARTKELKSLEESAEHGCLLGAFSEFRRLFFVLIRCRVFLSIICILMEESTYIHI